MGRDNNSRNDLKKSNRRAAPKNHTEGDTPLPPSEPPATSDQQTNRHLKEIINSFSPDDTGKFHRTFKDYQSTFIDDEQTTLESYAALVQLAGGTISLNGGILTVEGEGIQIIPGISYKKSQEYTLILETEPYMRASAQLGYDCAPKLPPEYENRWKEIRSKHPITQPSQKKNTPGH